MRKPCKDCRVNERAPDRTRCYSCYGRVRRQGDLKDLYNTTQKILFLDIETFPALMYSWGMFGQNHSVDQIVEPGGLLCFAAKWLGSEEMLFFSLRDGGRKKMVQAAWKLLNEADVVVHYYGSRFDIPHLNAEFLKMGLKPPSPFKQVDLKFEVSRNFRFISNKLQFFSTVIGLEGKVQHKGFSMWPECMMGDPEAWTEMETYNKRDTELMEECFHILLPWIRSLPNRVLYDGDNDQCPACSALDSLKAAGYAYTKLSMYKQYRCLSCGSFFRDSKRESGVSIQESVR